MKVKIQGHWLDCEILIVYKESGTAWYSLKGNFGHGWVTQGNWKL